MTITEEIEKLRAQLQAAVEEFDMAIAFHETWKPAAYDTNLIERMGVSLATNAFNVVRAALRREMLSTLQRLWDTDKRAVSMKFIATSLGNPSIIDALASNRGGGDKFIENEMRTELHLVAKKVIALVHKYSPNGSHSDVLEKLQMLRNEQFAHRQVVPSPTARSDEDFESLYQDNAELIRLLTRLVEGNAYNPHETAVVYRRYATFFWAGVRGERTEGHPDYRGPIKTKLE